MKLQSLQEEQYGEFEGVAWRCFDFRHAGSEEGLLSRDNYWHSDVTETSLFEEQEHPV